MRHEAGHVVALFRYPVKSMAAESVESVDVGWNGLSGDRRWAFVREGMQHNGFPWLTIRERPDMGRYVPRLVEPDRPEHSDTRVVIPSGEDMDIVDPALAAELGYGASLIRQSRGVFDAMPLSLITTQTVGELGSIVASALDVRRFRPNIVIAAAEDRPFMEDGWIGCVLQIGAMSMRVDRRDKRCVVVNVDPMTAARNPAVLRAIAQERQSCLGVYGSIAQPGRVSVGDAVSIQRER